MVKKWLMGKVYFSLLLLGLTSAACGTQLPTSFAMVADGAGSLYIADAGVRIVRKVDLAMGKVTTVAGTMNMAGSADGTGADARFYLPLKIALDNAGNLYVADDITIRKVVLSTGVVTTLAGTAGVKGSTDGTGAAARFNSPVAIAWNGADSLYISDLGSAAIRKLVLATGEVTTLTGACRKGEFDGIWSMATDGAGNLYFTKGLDHAIHKVVLGTCEVTTLAGSAEQSDSADGIGTAARFSYPEGVALDKAGNLYVIDKGNYTIRKLVLATGAVTTLAGTAGESGSADGVGAAARFLNTGGITADGAGNLYVGQDGSVRKIAIATGTVTTVPGTVGVFGGYDLP